jgi:DnaJ homolog subfamily A member 2
MTDLYKLLGISKTNDQEQIKKAYKKSALKWHPDRNRNNKEEAESKFKEISEAYDILSDTNKKNIYDNHGLDAVRQMNNGGGGGGNPFDLFENLFGGNPFGGAPFGGSPFGGSPFGGSPFGGFSRDRNKSPDRVEKISITLEDVYNQKKINLKLKKKVICSMCDGTGGKDKHNSFLSCDTCNGSGHILKIRQLGPGMLQQSQEACEKCMGKGKMMKPNSKCIKCSGNGIFVETKEIEVSIDKGIKDGDKITLAGESHQDPKFKEHGDLILIINIEDHKIFKRVGYNLMIRKEVLLCDALCGYKFDIIHLDGRKLLLRTNNVIDPYSKRVIRGEGMPTKNGNGHGDLLIEFIVSFPDNLSVERQQYIKKLLPSNNDIKYNLNNYVIKNMEYCNESFEETLNEVNLSESDDEQENPIQCQHQ